MAKDGNIQTPQSSTRGLTAGSDRDQFMDHLFERYQAGEIEMDEAMKLYDEKFGPPDLMNIGKGSVLAPAIPQMGSKVR